MADQNVEALKADLRAQVKIQKKNIPSSNPSLEAPRAPSFVPGGMRQVGTYVGDSKYDKNIAAADIPNIGAIRHERQSGLAQTVNMLNQAVVGEIAGGMVEGVGYLLDIAETFNTLGGKNEEWGNWISDIGKGIKDWTREATPIYKDPNASDFDPMSYSWWMSHMPSVASTLSLMIPAVGTMTAVNKVAKIMKLGEKLIKTGKAVGMGQKGLKVANAVIQGTGTAIVSRHMESMMEATGTWEAAYNEARSRDVDEISAKRIASDAAHTNYGLNWIALAQDIPQYMLLGKTFPKIKTTSLKVGKQGSKSLFKPFNNKALAIGMDGAWEGVEEGYQFITDEESKYLAFQRAGLSKEEPFNERLGKYLDDGELWSAAFFGALGGVAMQTAGKPISQAISGDVSAVKNTFTNLKEKAKKAFSKEKTISETGETGTKNYDTNTKIEDIGSWGSQYSAVQHHVREAIEWGSDQSKQNAALATVEKLAIRAAEDNKIQDMYDMLESMKNPSEEDLKTFGFDQMTEQELSDFKQAIPQYQETTHKVAKMWVDLARELSNRGEFINSPETRSRERVSMAIDLAIRNDRIQTNLEANNTELAQIEQDVPQLKKASSAVRDILRIESEDATFKKVIKSMKVRYDTGKMDGPEKLAYETSIKDTEKALEENKKVLERAHKELKPADKRTLGIIRGSSRFPRYQSLIASNTSLLTSSMVNAYEEGHLMRAIKKTAIEYAERQDEIDKASKQQRKDNLEQVEEQPTGGTLDLSTEESVDPTVPDQESPVEKGAVKHTTQENLEEVLDREKDKRSTPKETESTDPDDTGPQSTEVIEKDEDKRESILDGTPKLSDGVVVDTGTSESSDDKVYGNLYLPDKFPFLPGRTFESWAIPMYTNQIAGAANLIEHIKLLSQFLDIAIQDMNTEGIKVPKEIEKIATSLRNRRLNDTAKLTARDFIKFIDEHATIAREDLGVPGKMLYDAIHNTYNYLFDAYGPRQAHTAAEVKDYWKTKKDNALKDNRDYSEDPGGNNDSATHFFTVNPQYAMGRDKDTGVYFIITNAEGLPVTVLKDENGNTIASGDIFEELDWDNLNTQDYSKSKVYFEYDIGTTESDEYNGDPGDYYNRVEVPKYMKKHAIKDNLRPSHVIENQNIWIVTYENNDFTGKRTVLGSVPSGTRANKDGTKEIRSNIRSLRAKLNREFTKEYGEGNIIAGIPNTGYRGKKQGLKTRFIRAKTTTKVEQQLPGRLNVNPIPQKLISGKEILNIIPAKDLHIVIWNADAQRFEGTGPIETMRTEEGVYNPGPDIMRSLKNTHTANLTNGAAYLMLKSSEPGRYIPARMYNYLEEGPYMDKVIDLLMELRNEGVIWDTIKDDLKELLYSSYDIRPTKKAKGSENALIMSHTSRDGSVVLRTIMLDQGTEDDIRAQLKEALLGRFAMISKYRINTTISSEMSYNQLLIEGKESVNDTNPKPFIKIDISGAEKNLDPNGQRVYTSSTKFKITMPSMKETEAAPVPVETEEQFGEEIEFEEIETTEEIDQKKVDNNKKLDHEKTGVQDNETTPDKELTPAEMRAKMRKAFNKTKDRGSSNALRPDDERAMRKERIKQNKDVISQAEIEWFQAMFPGVPLSILPTVNHVVTTGGEKAWAVFQDASVRVVQKAPKGVLYHEAFHAVFVLSLTDKQRADILTEAKTKYTKPTTDELTRIKKEVAGITTDEQAEQRYFEELLAEEFREYALMNGTPAKTLGQKIAKWFRKMYALGRRLARRRVSVKGLFYDIHNGSYKIKEMPAHAKHVAAYMSQNDPDSLSVTKTEQAIREVNSMVIGKISEIAKDRFGTPRPHIDQVLQVIREYNMDPNEPGKPYDARIPYVGISAVYLDVAQTLFNTIEDNIAAGLIQEDDSKVTAYFKVIGELVDMDTIIAGEPVLGPLARKASIRLFQDYGIKVKITGVETTDSVSAEEILEEDPGLVTEFDNQNDTGVIKESWSVEPEKRSKKQTASFRVKFMLSNIPMLDKTGKPLLTFMGSPMLVKHSELYNKLQRSLSLEKGNLGKESMMEILNKIIISYPEVQAVVDQLEADPVLSAEFLATMTTTNASYIMILMKPGPDGTMEARTIESNRRSVDKMLINDWKEALSNPVTSPFNENLMSPKVREELADKAIKQAEIMKAARNSKKYVGKDRAREFSDLTRDLAFHTSDDILISILNTESPKTAVQYLNNYITILTNIKNGKNPFEQATAKQQIQTSKMSRPANITTSANQLAYMNAQYGIDLYEAGFTNVNNDKVFAHRSPNFISKRIAKLGHDDINVAANEKHDLQRDPYFLDNYLLRTMITNNSDRKAFKYAMMDGIKEEGRNKGKPYVDMGEKFMYITSINAWLNNGAVAHGWYKVSTLSNSPSSLYVQSRKESIGIAQNELETNILQEAKRIDKVIERHAKGVTPIENYDIDPKKRWESKGNKFVFFPFMNELLPKKYKGSVAEWVKANPAIVSNALEDYLNTEYKEFREKVMNSGATDEYGTNLNAESINKAIGDKVNAGDKKLAVESILKRYYWNSVLFNVNMIQISSGDMAFYKNNEDFQKRHKQIYSPGLVIDSKAEFTDESGNTTAVGATYNNLYLEDNNINTSLNIKAIEKGLRASVKNGNLSTSDMYNILAKYGYGYDSKLGEKQFLVVQKDGTTITVEKPTRGQIGYKIDFIVETDGQAYITLERFKKIYIGLGRWNAQYEEAYKRAKKGKATPDDIATVFRPLKPFYYGMVLNPETNLWMPTQNKNSEFVLLPQITNKSKKLDTLRKYMEKNDIDATNFHSAVKVGAYGVTSWSDIESNKKGVKAGNVNPASPGITGNILIHQNSNEDYKLQQETPDHYQNFEIKFGIQIAKLGLSDLNHTDGVEYTLQDGSKLSADELVQSFQDTMSAGIVTDYYYEAERFKDIDQLQKFLIQQMRDNGFGDEIESAFELYESTVAGKKIFKVSLNNPLYSNDTEKLLNAAFRNKVTTRKINGGQFVQVSSFGFSDKLKLTTNDKGGLEAIEVFMPWWSKDYFPLKDNGEVDFKKIQKEAPELLELIGYRIPTEDKYSMAPIKVKGFLPKEAGGSIILPSDITTISGSDFDIDKLYVMIPKFKITPSTNKINIIEYKAWDTSSDEDLKAIWKKTKGKELWVVDRLIEAIEIAATKNIHKKEALKRKLQVSPGFSKDIDIFMQEQLNKEIATILEGKSKYTVHNLKQRREEIASMTEAKFIETYRGTPPAFFNSKDARNNHLINVLRAVLQNEHTYDKIVNPGSFQRYKDDRDRIKELRGDQKKDMNIILPQNDIDFALRNNAGSKLVGIAANHNTNHAIMQHTDIHLSEGTAVYFWVVNEKGNLEKQKGQSLSESQYTYWENGKLKTEYISKNLASIVAMVVDNAKDPVSGEINLNKYTANVLSLILRTGFHHTVASMFIAHPMIVEITNNYFNMGAIRSAANGAIDGVMYRKLMPALKIVMPGANNKTIEDYIKNEYQPSQPMFEKHIKDGEAFTRGINALLLITAAKKDSQKNHKDIKKREFYELKRKQGDTLAIQMGYTSFTDMYTKLLTKENILANIGVVEHFRKLRSTGEQLGQAVSLTRSDSHGPGTTMVESTMMVDKFEDMEEYPADIVNLKQLTAPEKYYSDTGILKPINIPIPSKRQPLTTTSQFTTEDIAYIQEYEKVNKKLADQERIKLINDNRLKSEFTTTQWMDGSYSTPHTFYEFGVVKPTKLMEEHYIWNTAPFVELRNKILLNSGLDSFSAEHIRHINYSLYTYIADGFSFFNTTESEKTDLVKNLPQRLYQFKLDNPELVDKDPLLKRLIIRTDKDHPRIQFDNGSPLSKSEAEEVRRRWQEMFHGEHHQLAIDLAKYSFHTLGFIFSPYSFGNLLSNYYYTDVMKHEDMTFDEYILNMRKPGGMLDTTGFNEFYDQFMMNHSHQNEYVPAPKEAAQGGKIPADLTIVHSTNSAQYFYTDQDKVVHPKDYTSRTYYVEGIETKVLYRLDGVKYDSKGNPTATYVRTNKLGIPNFLYEYRYNIPGNAMVSIMDVNNVEPINDTALRAGQFFTKSVIKTTIKIGEDNVVEQEARRILTEVMQGFRAAYDTVHTLDSYVTQMLTRMMKDPKGPTTIEGIHELLGTVIYDQLPEANRTVINNMIWADPSLPKPEQHKYKMMRLGGNMLTNTSKKELTPEMELFINPAPDVDQPKSGNVSNTILKKVFVPFNADNDIRIKSGTKTTTIRSPQDAKAIGLDVGQSGTMVIEGEKFIFTHRGYLTVEQAGGLNSMIKSEGYEEVSQIMFPQSKNWMAGKGKLHVYDIRKASIQNKMIGSLLEKGRVGSPKGRVDSPKGTSIKKTINIYAGTNENAELSNFANRPFTHNNIKFESVEQAFQYAKGEFYNIYSIDPADTTTTPEILRAKVDKHLKDILNTTTGVQAKALGRKNIGVDFEDYSWNDKSSEIMKDLLRGSFEQNPNALQTLLATGNKVLTHTQDKGKWGKLFPELLMEIRSELGGSIEKTVTQGLKIKGTVGSVDNVDMILNNERKVLAVPGNENRVDSYSNLQVLLDKYRSTGKPVTSTIILKGKNGIEKTVSVTYHGYGTVNLANTAVRKVDGKAIIASMRKSAENFKLNKEGTRYLMLDGKGEPIPGEEYMRVSEFANGKSEGVSENAVQIGNAIDNIIRDVMAITDPAKEIKFLDKGHEQYRGTMSKTTYFKIASQAAKLKNKWIAEGKTIISQRIILHNDKMGPDKNQKVAGEIDLMTIDNDGRVEIIDTKTIRSMTNYYNMYDGSTKYDKHSRQVNTYAILLNNTYGISTSALSILPVKVEYEGTRLNSATLIPSPLQPGGLKSDMPYRIELPPTENINKSRKDTWYMSRAGIKNEKSDNIKNTINSFNEGKDKKHVFTFDTNGSVTTQLNTKESEPTKRVSPIPDTSGITVKEYITDVNSLTPIFTNVVRVGSMFGGNNQAGQIVKMVINGFSEKQVHFTNISEGKTKSMLISELNNHIANGNITHYGTFPLIEYRDEYYMYDNNTYYPLNPTATMSEEIEKYRKEEGAKNFNSLKSHILQEMVGSIKNNKIDNVSDLDTEHITKYCRKVK